MTNPISRAGARARNRNRLPPHGPPSQPITTLLIHGPILSPFRYTNSQFRFSILSPWLSFSSIVPSSIGLFPFPFPLFSPPLYLPFTPHIPPLYPPS